jgi:hypothetical protein
MERFAPFIAIVRRMTSTMRVRHHSITMWPVRIPRLPYGER